MTTRWQIMEQWLDYWHTENHHAPFSCRDLARSLDISTSEATMLIQAYQHEQWRAESRTVFVLKRHGRTRTARWSIGVRRKDLRQVNVTFYEDMMVKATRAFEPTLHRLAILNPQQAKEVEQVIDGTLKGAFQVMRAALRI